jgi:hypothetical protein
MMREDDFRTSPEEMILGSHTTTNSLTVMRNPLWMCRHNRKQQLPQKGLSPSFLSLERHSCASASFSVDKIQSRSLADHRRARIVRKKNEYRARGWQQSTACAFEQFDVSESAQIREYFAGKSMTRVARRSYSPDISPPGFCFHGYAKKQIKNRVITEGDDLEAH